MPRITLQAKTEMVLENSMLDSRATDHLVRADLEYYILNVTTLYKSVKILVANNKIMQTYNK